MVDSRVAHNGVAMTVIEWLDRYAGWLLSALIVGVFLGLVSGVWPLFVVASFLLAVIIAAVLVSHFAAPFMPSRVPASRRRNRYEENGEDDQK
jgi:uncharacterized protein (DUF58 family)